MKKTVKTTVSPERSESAAASLNCSHCTVGNCARLTKSFPDFCLTVNTKEEIIKSVTKRYVENPEDRKISLTSAEIEADYYGRATRVEEILLFIKKMGYKKVGAATCAGLLNECGQFARAARVKGIGVYGVACKVGAVDKTTIGLAEEKKLSPGVHESMCNPILQAELLNQQETDFNVIIGLCVGHDSLFIRHSKAPVSYLIVKDRVLCHNPAAALYGAGSYYRRLLEPGFPEPRKQTKKRKEEKHEQNGQPSRTDGRDFGELQGREKPHQD
ncbi:MAG: DUF1847 domain-containing protein [Synergistaceae bacterium]|nr:DUF1847 domain-containing protein [Synergistaceae bacterium]